VSPAAPPPPARNAAYDRLEAAFASLRPGKPGFARQVITAFDPPLDVLLPPDEALALALAVDDIDTEDVSGAASCVRWVRAWITHGRLPV
jgi:hypothetical protein